MISPSKMHTHIKQVNSINVFKKSVKIKGTLSQIPSQNYYKHAQVAK